MKTSFMRGIASGSWRSRVFLLPFAVIGAIRAKTTSKNDVKNWIPKEYEETKVFASFRQTFRGGDEFILISWDETKKPFAEGLPARILA